MTDEQRPWQDTDEYRDFLYAAGDPSPLTFWTEGRDAALTKLLARVWREASQTYSKRVIPQWADTVVAEDAERARADAAEAQRDRLQRENDALADGSWREHRPATSDEHGIEGRIHGYCRRCIQPWPCPYSPEARNALTAQRDRLAAALDETAQWLHHVLHNWPGAAERFEACPVLPCCRNCEVLGRPYSGWVQDADSTLSGTPIMPTLTDEEHAAVERTLTRTQEARESRKRDEAYRAMVQALLHLTSLTFHGSYVPQSCSACAEAQRALALARQVEEA